jgi:hypothetical protein
LGLSRFAEPARNRIVRFANITGETRRVSMADDNDDVERERTTIVETGNGGGGGGVLAVVLLIIVVLVLLFLFRGQLGFGSKTVVPNKVDVNINQS